MPILPWWALTTLLYASPYETVITERRSTDMAADAATVAVEDVPLALDGAVSTLGRVSGLQLTRLGGLGAPLWVSLRGSSTAQVAVFVDGVPLGGLAQSSVDLNALPWDDIAQVDVYRGVSPLIFGTGALGGVLAFGTRVPQSTSARAGVGYGSFDTYGADLQGTVYDPGLVWHGGLHAIRSSGAFLYDSDGGTAFTSANNHAVRRANNALAQGSLFAGGRLRRGDHRLRFWVWGMQKQQGVPSLGIRQTQHTQLRAQQLITNLAWRLALPGSGVFETQVYAQGIRQRFSDPDAEVMPYPVQSDDRSFMVGARAHWSRRMGERAQWATVLQARRDTFSPRDAASKSGPDGASGRSWGSAGMELDMVWGTLHVVPSVLLEGILDDRAGRNPFGQTMPATPWQAFVPQGRLGLWQDIGSDWSWRANLARYGRLPSALELYGDSRGILGNSALLPETGYNADLGAKLAPAGAALPWRAEVTLFAAYSRDLITFQQNAVGQARAWNLGHARVLGMEGAWLWQPRDWLTGTVQAGFMDARDVSDTPFGRAEVFLPNRSRWHVLVQPSARYRGLHARIDIDWVGGIRLDPANLVHLPDRLLFGAAIGWHFSVFDLALRVQNVLDARVFDVAGFPLPSRSLMLTLRMQSSVQGALQASPGAS